MGDSIRAQADSVLAALGVGTGPVGIDDRGGLPFGIAARIEAAVRRAEIGKGSDARRERTAPLPAPSARDRLRRSRLYLPGNEPKFMINAALHEPDAVILDLEDSVHHGAKDAARLLVCNALRCIDFGAAERMVRINQLPPGGAEPVPLHRLGAGAARRAETEVPRRSQEARKGVESSFYLSGILPPRRRDHEPIMLQVFCEPEELWLSTPWRLCTLNRELQRQVGMPVHTVAVFINGGPAGREDSWCRDVTTGGEPRRFHYTSLGLTDFPAAELLRRPEPLVWALAPVAETQDVGSRTDLRLACLHRALEYWRRDPTLANHRWNQLFDFIATSVVWEVDPLVLAEEFLADPSENLTEWITGWLDKVTSESIPASWQADWLALELSDVN